MVEFKGIILKRCLKCYSSEKIRSDDYEEKFYNFKE